MSGITPFRRRARVRWPDAWRPYLRRRGLSLAQVRMMIWTGLLLGLLAFQALRLWTGLPLVPDFAPAGPGPLPSASAPVDPYAEAVRSRAILAAQESAPQPAGDARPDENRPERAGAPVRVIDGDTFDHGGMRIRIADIDTPEVRGRCPAETALAARATARMRALLAAGPFELNPLASGRDEDRYGRKLRIVTRNGRSLGDVLVAEGLARTWTGRREPWC